MVAEAWEQSKDDARAAALVEVREEVQEQMAVVREQAKAEAVASLRAEVTERVVEEAKAQGRAVAAAEADKAVEKARAEAKAEATMEAQKMLDEVRVEALRAMEAQKVEMQKMVTEARAEAEDANSRKVEPGTEQRADAQAVLQEELREARATADAVTRRCEKVEAKAAAAQAALAVQVAETREQARTAQEKAEVAEEHHRDALDRLMRRCEQAEFALAEAHAEREAEVEAEAEARTAAANEAAEAGTANERSGRALRNALAATSGRVAALEAELANRNQALAKHAAFLHRAASTGVPVSSSAPETATRPSEVEAAGAAKATSTASPALSPDPPTAGASGDNSPRLGVVAKQASTGPCELFGSGSDFYQRRRVSLAAELAAFEQYHAEQTVTNPQLATTAARTPPSHHRWRLTAGRPVEAGRRNSQSPTRIASLASTAPAPDVGRRLKVTK